MTYALGDNDVFIFEIWNRKNRDNGNISNRYNIFTKIYNTFETWKRGTHLHTGL